ncbi:MerR family transcriptional regulator [Sphingosinicella sp. CPCC 101087]|uniref:MerR family transcriptional regulator n=1 Tax=Sphingosinicella sp. CPCC 101087 TaxID=2497754 RepID=UPI00101C0A25|nr:MerR family transcriptional regulator [Sphingosinicella sp. CPCC 101087]
MQKRRTRIGYTVGEVAKVSGVSIRTLHHYDELGLLKPALVGENGYRFYGRQELQRLQQIMFHRELGLSLAEIRRILEEPEYDRLAALRNLRERMIEERRRSKRLLQTLENTIAELEGSKVMDAKKLFDGFDPARQAEYEEWIIDRFGECARGAVEANRRRWSEMNADERQTFMAEMNEIVEGLAKGYASGVAPDDPLLDPLLSRHYALVALSWARQPTAEAYARLGQLFASNPEYLGQHAVQNPGLPEWVAAAMAAYGPRGCDPTAPA